MASTVNLSFTFNLEILLVVSAKPGAVHAAAASTFIKGADAFS